MQVKQGINFPHPPPLQLPIPPTPSCRRRPSTTGTGQLTSVTSDEQKKYCPAQKLIIMPKNSFLMPQKLILMSQNLFLMPQFNFEFKTKNLGEG
jgi:hypothetical protein